MVNGVLSDFISFYSFVYVAKPYSDGCIRSYVYELCITALASGYALAIVRNYNSSLFICLQMCHSLCIHLLSMHTLVYICMYSYVVTVYIRIPNIINFSFKLNTFII